MNRAAAAPGTVGRVPVLLLAAALALGACEVSGVESPPPSSAGSPATRTPEPITSPELTESPAPPETTPAGGTAPTSDPTISARPTDDPAADCTGTDANRDFFAAVAEAVDWDVYCAVLPNRWFIETGSYRLGGGGRLEVVYRGPDSARLELREGAFCQEANGCVPDGTNEGDAPFGLLDAIVVAGHDGSMTLVVGRGEPVSWVATGHGFDYAAMLQVGASLLLVGD